ncbi:hypothetical protein C8Q78DRAFT_1081608 [Trametes maxima]|nr:hypothetical protein C8Q78DRAFT_1081608 [Trametes maxima]
MNSPRIAILSAIAVILSTVFGGHALPVEQSGGPPRVDAPWLNFNNNAAEEK